MYYRQGLNGMGDVDWGNLFADLTKTAVGAYGTVSAIKAQKELQEAQAKQQLIAQNPFLNYGMSPTYSPVYTAQPVTGAINWTPILIFGGLGLAAFFLLRK